MLEEKKKEVRKLYIQCIKFLPLAWVYSFDVESEMLLDEKIEFFTRLLNGGKLKESDINLFESMIKTQFMDKTY
ncbi:MAG: hypothetical protein MJ185_02745 [Treponema sp.]|nr:hypothetical protein [Treponema sp.]